MIDYVQNLTTLTDLDIEHTKTAAAESMLYDPEVIAHLMKIFRKEPGLKETHLLKLYAIRGISNMITTLQNEYLEWLTKNSLLTELFSQLVEVSNQ